MLPFGLLSAPYWFQYVMDCLVGDIHEAAAYVDDLTVRGHTW